MKRFFLSFMLIFMVTLLAGCISIPLGDDILEISEDGVKYYKAGPRKAVEEKDNSDMDDDADRSDESLETESDSKDKNAEMSGKASNNNLNKSPNESESTDQSNSSDDKSGFGSITDSDLDKLQEMFDDLERIGREIAGNITGDSGSSKETNHNKCEEGIDQDYANIREKLNHDFYFPPCAEVILVSDENSSLEFVLRKKLHFTTVDQDYDIYLAAAKTIQKGYRDLAGHNLISEYSNVAMAEGTIEFYLHGNNKGKTHVYHQLRNGYIYIEVTYDYP